MVRNEMLHAFQFCFSNAIKRVQENQDDFELSGTHQLQVIAGDDKLLGENMNTIKGKH
jgi:hypothetical protein